MNARKKITLILFISAITCKGQMITPVAPNIGGRDFAGFIYSSVSVFFTAINIPTTYFNIKKLHIYDKYRENAVFGALSGVAQTALGVGGIINLSGSKKETMPNYTYFPTVINVGLGLTTTATSIIRLATKNPPKENMTFNVIYFPSPQNTAIVGFHFTKRF